MNQLIDNMMHTNYQHCFFHQCHSSNAYIYIAALCTRFVLVREMVQLGKLFLCGCSVGSIVSVYVCLCLSMRVCARVLRMCMCACVRI